MHNRYPRVTIGIPTYNRADDYLKQTLTSALNQTYENLEIVVADNCSTDNTENYVNSISDPRIRYFRHNKNIQPNDNFNFCLEQARGDYFLLLHDDDLIDDDFIETCMKALNNHTDIGIVRTGTRVIDSDGKLLNEAPNADERLSTEELFRKWFAWKTALYLCSTVFNTMKLREIGGFQSKHNLFQDALAELQLAAKYGRIDVQDIKASFRRHSFAMTSATKTSHWCEDSLFLLDAICDMASEKKTLIRKEGLHYFCKFNYELSNKIKSPSSRFAAYLEMLIKFRSIFIYQTIYRVLCRSPLYSPLRFIKQRFTGSKNPKS